MKPADDDTGETLAAYVDAVAVPTPTTSMTGGATRIGDRYEILQMLGIGGMGAVYKVRDLELDEIVALKVLKRELVDTPGMLARFRQEVKLARRVTHPNVVRTFDLGEHGDERFITMEYVEGRSLARILCDEGALSWHRALPIARQLCAGVAAAHAAGVLHRDLKPDNVLVDGEGRVAITDFGIARARHEVGLAQTIGGAVGTPAYMAPEQVRGAREVDGRADVYALGAVLYEMLTGQRAWPGTDVFAVALARLHHAPPDPRAVRRDLAPELAEIVLRCLASSIEGRYPSAEAVDHALASLPDPTLRSTPVGPLPARDAMPAPGATTVAVLPFRNGGPPEAGYVADGLTEELIDTLSMTRGLRVRPLGAVARHAGGDPREAGRALDVQIAVDGSVRPLGDRLRISVRMVSVDTGYQLWAKRFECSTADALQVSDQIAEALSEALTVDLERPARAGGDGEAVDLYLRARHLIRANWHGDLAPALELLEQAVSRQPDDAASLAALAVCKARQAFFSSDHAALGAEAIAAGERAVALAPQLGEAWVALGAARLNTGDWAGAAVAFRSALQRAPALAKAQEQLAVVLLETGRIDEAISRLEAALSLDPTAWAPRWELVRANALLGRWTRVRAIVSPPPESEGDRFAGSMSLNRLQMWTSEPLPDLGGAVNARFPPSMQVAALLMQARREIAQTRTIAPHWRALFRPEVVPPGPRLRSIAAQMQVEIQQYVGDTDEAFEWLARGVASGLHDRVWMERCPLLDPMRSDPRWAAPYATVRERADRVLAALDAVPG